MRGPIFLVGSGQGGLGPQLAARALRETGARAPRVAVTYAPAGGDARAVRSMRQSTPRLFPGATVTVLEDHPHAIDEADLVFVSGGDPVQGAKDLARSGIADAIRAASARGVATMGISAGAILLGDWWADWPDDDDETGGDVPLVACLGVAAAHVFDTHDEGDDWGELRTVAKSLRSRGLAVELIGIPSGGALVLRDLGEAREPREPREPSDGWATEVVGNPPFTLR